MNRRRTRAQLATAEVRWACPERLLAVNTVTAQVFRWEYRPHVVLLIGGRHPLSWEKSRQSCRSTTRSLAGSGTSDCTLPAGQASLEFTPLARRKYLSRRQRSYSSPTSVSSRHLYDGVSQGRSKEVIKVVNAGGGLGFQSV